jgi:hypothetical protein
VVEGGDGAGLALEAAQPLGVPKGFLGQDLEGDLTSEAGVAGSIDFTHPPGTQRGEDLVRADATPRRQQSFLFSDFASILGPQ